MLNEKPMDKNSHTIDLEKVIKEIKVTIKGLFSSSVVAHDISHLERVYRVALSICVATDGNQLIVAVASYLHDYHRFIEKNIGRYVSPEEAEPQVRVLLNKISSIPNELHDPICNAINFTEYFRCAGDDISEKNSALESRIVRDADMLDAMGAVGIARAFMFGGFLGEPIWVCDGDNTKKKNIFLHGKTSSIVHHFHEKLLKLELEMLTPQGRKIATNRSIYMNQFIDQLMSEIV